ncbi:MAG: hypothetical protein JKY96_02940 [Phycisphaerales bacterium]|nr:hypothetical protein [Phycisphaerales bacterium]
MTTPPSTTPSFPMQTPIRFLCAAAGAITLCLGALGGCNTPQTQTPSINIPYRGGATIEAVDPAKTPFHGWKRVDQGVTIGAMEELIIARVIETDGVRSRKYSLRTLQGNPGSLRVTRQDVGLGIEPSAGLLIECQIRQTGNPGLEQNLLDAIRRAMLEQHRLEHED